MTYGLLGQRLQRLGHLRRHGHGQRRRESRRPAITLSTPGTYYWQATYSGDTDSNNAASVSTCGSEVETVSAVSASTSLSTSLSGGGSTGATISVPASTAVTDKATLSGTNAASAGGTVTYSVYSDNKCSDFVAGGGTVTVSAGSVPASSTVSLSTPGTYYWQASYSGDTDSNNAASVSTCGSEVETVSARGGQSTGLDHVPLGRGLDGHLHQRAGGHRGQRHRHLERDQRGQRRGHGDLQRLFVGSLVALPLRAVEDGRRRLDG